MQASRRRSMLIAGAVAALVATGGAASAAAGGHGTTGRTGTTIKPVTGGPDPTCGSIGLTPVTGEGRPTIHKPGKAIVLTPVTGEGRPTTHKPGKGTTLTPVICDGTTLVPVGGVHPHHIKPAGSQDDPELVEVPGVKLPKHVEPGRAGVTQAR
ncbi:hypothetical protein ACH40F_55340 [Streptomyces sp. NPDC020794]|uniref:hypothetical protein n=1 Tax=unclassified Streptomyces TaxID=2593676 RepID=UPI0036EAB484